MNIRNFQPGDERTQASLYNACAFSLPGFKPATEDDVRRRTRARSFDPECRFYAERDGQVVGYCTLEPDQGRISYPWCRKGFENVAPVLFESALRAAKARGITRLFAAYRRDWDPVLAFFSDNGFERAREIVNYFADPVDLPTVASRGGRPVRKLQHSDLPILAEMGKGLIRVSGDDLERYCFSNPYFPVESFIVLEGRDDSGPIAIGLGLESPSWADVKKVDALAPCFRIGAFGTEGRNVKRVNGMFSFVVGRPEQAIPAGLALLTEASQEMTEGSVNSIAAQCPTDVPHLIGFYARYFKEQGRFPVLERTL